jgi:hypothetical protein
MFFKRPVFDAMHELLGGARLAGVSTGVDSTDTNFKS